MVADAHEIHKTSQNTRDQNKTLSVLWACTAPRFKASHKKQQQRFAPFLLGCSECVAKEGERLLAQARASFRSTPSSVTQSNPVPAGGCGLAPRTPFRVRVAVRELKLRLRLCRANRKELPE